MRIFWLFCGCISIQLNAQIINNNSILYLEKIDNGINHSPDSSVKKEAQIQKQGKIISFPDIYYEYRIEELDKQSPIKLDFNEDVLKYIKLYLEKRPDKIAEFLGLSELYFPVFEEYLDKYNLPLELKYLPVIESGLDPLARSSSGAMGLWQLLLNSSKLLGLQVNSYVDERCDLYRSTDAACRYLKYLFNIFNDWQLTLAAYNGGPGEIRNAIARSGGKTTFWQIQPYLPEQTKWYVPAYIAVVYLANNAKEHGISPSQPSFTYNNTDTLWIQEAVEFSKLSEKTEIPIETIRFLNPAYRREYIPDMVKSMPLVLPSNKILTFLKIENQIYSRTNDTSDYLDVLSAAGDTNGLKKIAYTVLKGDFLHKIAMEYGCTLENLRAWNSLQNDNLSEGQKLLIWLPETDNEVPKNYSSTQKTKKPAHYFYYTVKKGDTMWSIANRFNCDSINTIKTANNIADERDLKPGQKLKILVND
jgi:membrane-bound lytic murein transglycosylase D